MTNSKPYVEITDVNEGGALGFTLTFFRLPVPASRPRVPKFGPVYYAKTYATYKKDAKEAIPNYDNPPLEGALFADITFVCKKARTSKLDFPRGDFDNFAKAICDAINGERTDPKGYWHDDNQIVTARIHKRFAEPDETPHTKVVCREL